MVDGASILVTGATGNVGGAVVRELHKRNAPAVAAVTQPAKAALFESRGITTADLDFGDRTSLARAMDGVACVFLLMPFDQRMTVWADDAMRAARQAGVAHVVRLSGFGADPDSDCLLNRVQGRIDRLVLDSGLPCTLLRPNAFMQNFSVYYGDMVRRRGALHLPDGDGRTSFVDARDIAAVAAEVLLDHNAYDGQALEITGAKALSGTEVAEILSGVVGRAVTYHPVDEPTARAAMQGMPAWNIEALLSLSAYVRAGGAEPVRDTVPQITGRATTSFEQFARDHAAAWSSPQRGDRY